LTESRKLHLMRKKQSVLECQEALLQMMFQEAERLTESRKLHLMRKKQSVLECQEALLEKNTRQLTKAVWKLLVNHICAIKIVTCRWTKARNGAIDNTQLWEGVRRIDVLLLFII